MTEPITVATDTERVTVRGVARTEWTHDGTLELFDADDTAIGEFPGARYAVVADKLDG